jgi:D-lactate dehydrogenase (cytochrome)
MYNRSNPAERSAVEHVVHSMVDTALEMEGTCTGEHGIGLGKKESLVKELGVETIEVMQTIKKSLDPHWLMNPGKIFDAPGMVPQGDVSKATAASTLDRPERKKE